MPKKRKGTPKGYKERSSKSGSKGKSTRKGQFSVGIKSLLDQVKKHGIRSLNREQHERVKLYHEERAIAKRQKLTTFEERKESFIDSRREARLRHQVIQANLEDIGGLLESIREDEDELEREERFDEFVDEWGIDLDEWLEIAEDLDYSEHEAYELWYYP